MPIEFLEPLSADQHQKQFGLHFQLILLIFFIGKKTLRNHVKHSLTPEQIYLAYKGSGGYVS